MINKQRNDMFARNLDSGEKVFSLGSFLNEIYPLQSFLSL